MQSSFVHSVICIREEAQPSGGKREAFLPPPPSPNEFTTFQKMTRPLLPASTYRLMSLFKRGLEKNQKANFNFSFLVCSLTCFVYTMIEGSVKYNGSIIMSSTCLTAYCSSVAFPPLLQSQSPGDFSSTSHNAKHSMTHHLMRGKNSLMYMCKNGRWQTTGVHTCRDKRVCTAHHICLHMHTTCVSCTPFSLQCRV